MKPKLCWPSIASELETSAKRRQIQRDREARRAIGTNTTNSLSSTSGKKTTPKLMRRANATIVKSKDSKEKLKLATAKKLKTTNAVIDQQKPEDKICADENLPPPPSVRLKQKPITFFFAGCNQPSIEPSIKEDKYQNHVLPDLNELFPDRPMLVQYFGRALAIVQFIYRHRCFLNKPTFRGISGTALLTAISEGDASAGIVESALRLLVDFLSNDGKLKLKIETIQQHALRFRRVVITSEEQLDLIDCVKLLLGDNVFAELSDALQSTTQFYQLSISSQLALFEHFIQRIHTSNSFHAYIDDAMKNEFVEAQKNRDNLEQRITNLRQELGELEKVTSTYIVEDDNIRLFTRGQTAEANKNLRLISGKRAELEELSPQFTKASEHCKLLKLASKHRTIALGKDRFHRTYWYFAECPDENTIFIQQQEKIHTNGNDKKTEIDQSKQRRSNNTADDDERFEQQPIEKRIEEGRGNEEEERWWFIDTADEYNKLCECLCERDECEYHLKKQLLVYKNVVLPKLKIVDEVNQDKKGIDA